MESGNMWESVRLIFRMVRKCDAAADLADAIHSYPADVPNLTERVRVLMDLQRKPWYVESINNDTHFAMQWQRSKGDPSHWYAEHVDGNLKINETTLGALRKLHRHSNSPQAAVATLKARWIVHVQAAYVDVLADSPAWFVDVPTVTVASVGLCADCVAAGCHVDGSKTCSDERAASSTACECQRADAYGRHQ